MAGGENICDIDALFSEQKCHTIVRALPLALCSSELLVNYNCFFLDISLVFLIKFGNDPG